VKSGETLSAIAKRYGTTAAAIEQANGLDSKSILSPGQMIYIPKKPR
jgi:LysM repeat protein